MYGTLQNIPGFLKDQGYLPHFPLLGLSHSHESDSV